MTYKIVTQEARTFNAEDVVEDVSYEFNGDYIYYVFLGKHTTYSNSSDNPTKPKDSESAKRQVYNDMLFGKRVTTNDARVMIDRYDYASGVVYDMYDDTDKDLYSKKFFVSVKRGTSRDVFKCLDNYNGSVSTTPPNKLDIEDYDEIYRTGDGYVWKYMYTIPGADLEKFATVDYLPVVPNTSVSSSADNGTIDVIVVESPGSGYSNYLAGTLGKGDLNIDGNQRKIDVSGNNKSSTVDDYYRGCVFKVVSGTSTGLYSRVESYDVYGSKRVITIADDINLDITSEYEIMPEVRILGDYTETVTARARAVVNSVSSANTIDYVEILDRGSEYKYATAYVYSESVVPVTSNSTVRPIIGPYGGHGYDANNELGASKVCFSVTFNEAVDTNNLPSVNDFRQVGVMSNPKFRYVEVNLNSKDAQPFIEGEKIYQVNPIRLRGTGVTLSTSTSHITADDNSASFTDLSANTILYIVGNSSRQLATVTGITNSTYMTIDTTGNFACNDCEIYLANVSAMSIVHSDLDAAGVAVTDISKPYSSGDRVVGYDSGASGVVENMVIANKETIFNTFNQMWKYYIIPNGTFEEDEVIYQPDSAANSHARLFGIVEDGSNTIMHVTNQVGYINTGQSVYGLTSEDSAYVSYSYEPDLIYNSGRIIYLENLEKVPRVSGQKETFKIIFSY